MSNTLADYIGYWPATILGILFVISVVSFIVADRKGISVKELWRGILGRK